jgi:hypothetical protein
MKKSKMISKLTACIFNHNCEKQQLYGKDAE